MNCSNPEEILATLPIDYTVEMAFENHDVLYTPEGQSYNVSRLHHFVLSVESGIPDCIILTKALGTHLHSRWFILSAIQKVSLILIHQGLAIFCCLKIMCAGCVQYPFTYSTGYKALFM